MLADYDMALARVLVSGVDVWLNTPLRPLEACGTSGMKAALNGVLNLSILDGWWDECYAPAFGWAIPSADGDALDADARDAREAALHPRPDRARARAALLRARRRPPARLARDDPPARSASSRRSCSRRAWCATTCRSSTCRRPRPRGRSPRPAEPRTRVSWPRLQSRRPRLRRRDEDPGRIRRFGGRGPCAHARGADRAARRTPR